MSYFLTQSGATDEKSIPGIDFQIEERGLRDKTREFFLGKLKFATLKALFKKPEVMKAVVLTTTVLSIVAVVAGAVTTVQLQNAGVVTPSVGVMYREFTGHGMKKIKN